MIILAADQPARSVPMPGSEQIIDGWVKFFSAGPTPICPLHCVSPSFRADSGGVPRVIGKSWEAFARQYQGVCAI
ncbi:MAG: hypothetical protein ACRDOX_08575, partial [Nocardioides sp.]